MALTPRPSIPRQAEDFTAAWLSDVLGTTVHDVAVTDIGAGAGIFGVVLRLDIDTDGASDGESGLDRPRSLIAKLPTTAPANLEIGLALRLYEREIGFYRELAADMPVRVPHPYATLMDPEVQTFCLLLEDLGSFTVGDQIKGLTQPHAELVTDALAALHAHYWCSPSLGDMAWLPELADPMYMAAVPPIYHDGWPVVRERFADLIEPAAVRVGDAVDERFEEVLDRCTRGPLTLIHTDTRLDNLCFAADGESEGVAIIDWQLALRGRGPADLAYLLGTSMNVADQDRLFEPLLRRYHDGLVAGGVGDYTIDQCRRDYAEHALYYLCGAVSISATFDTGNERGAALARAFVERQFHHALVCDAAAML